MEVLYGILVSVGGGLVGFLAALATQAGRMRGIEKDIESVKATATRDREEHNREMARVLKTVEDACTIEQRHFEETARRQLAMLTLQSDIAAKIGVTRRLLPDAISRDEG